MNVHGTTLAVAAALVAVGALAADAVAGGPFALFPLTPCRVVDTRNPPGPSGGPTLHANTQRSFPIQGACGVPATAQAVVFNVTVVAPTDLGDLRIFPAGTPVPFASVINWVTTDFAVANGALIPLGSDGLGNHVTVLVDMIPGSPGQVDLVLDVTGYFQ
jgi:hypothetical protein